MKKNHFLLVILVILIIAGLAAFFLWPYPLPQKNENFRPNVSQATHEAAGFGSAAARVDSQITLSIPENQVEAVYQYLKDTYVGKDNLLPDKFPGARLSGEPQSDVSIFTDEYFDTPNLDLFRNENSARYRRRVNTTDPADRKSGRELVQVKVTPPGQFDLRSEVKYEVSTPPAIKSDDDAHPLLGLVKSSQRPDFKKMFTDVNIDPASLRRILTVEQTRRRVYLDLDGVNFISFSVDTGAAAFLWADAGFTSIDIGLVEVAYTGADEAKRKLMRQIRDALVKDLVNHFPDLRQAYDSKYGIVLTELMEQIHALPYLIKWQLYDMFL